MDYSTWVQWLLSLAWFDYGHAFWTGLGGVAGYLAAVRINRKNVRSTHNFAALSQLTQSGSQATAYSKVICFFAKYPDAEVIPISEIRANAAIEEQIIVMLGMYQFLAFSVVKKLLDRKLVIDQFLPSMHSLLTRLGPYIEEQRKLLKRPRAWSELEEFVQKEWKPRR